MKSIISKEELEKIKKIKGQVRGMGMKTHAAFILQKQGEERVRKLEETMERLGYPIEYKKIKALTFYPLFWEALTLILIQKLFNYKDKDFQDLGSFHARDSVVIRTFLKYFISIDSMANNISKVWEKYFTEPGEFKVIEFDKDKRTAIFRIEGFDFHPLHCQINIGIISTLVELLTKKEASCEETKCVYRGDDCDEFVVRW